MQYVKTDWESSCLMIMMGKYGGELSTLRIYMDGSGLLQNISQVGKYGKIGKILFKEEIYAVKSIEFSG